MANLFFLPWAIVRDVAGVGIPGAQMLFTVEGGNTKSSVYQDEALTTAHTNPVICDGVGNPPIIYMNPAVSYRVRFYDRDAEVGVDTPVKDFDPYVPGIFADASALEPVADAAADSAAAAAVSAGEAADSATEAAGAIDAATQAQAAVTSITAALGTTVLTLAQLVASGMPLNARWFGLGSTEAEINLAIVEAKGLRNTGEGYASAGPPVYVPYGDWTLNSTVAWDHALHIFGDFGSGPSGGGTVLRTASNFTALLENPGASGSIIRNLFLKGSYVATESAAHGIHFKDKATIRDVFIEYFAGDGIYADTTADSSNVNDSEIHHPFIRYCRNGIYLAGADANALLISHPEMMLNRRYGGWLKDTIGSTLIGGDYSTNARNADGTSSAMCTYSSKWYFVLPGQEAGASTNAPSGTTANNTWWGYIGTGSADGQHPAWTSGLTWISGGVLRIEGGSSYCALFGGYAEGDQPPVQLDGHVLMMAPLLGTAVQFDGAPYGGQITGDTAHVQVPSAFTVGNDSVAPASKLLTVGGDIVLSPASGQSYDPTLRINSTNSYGTILWQTNGVDKAGAQWDSSNGNLILSNAALGGGHVLTNSNAGAALTRLIFTNTTGTHELRYERRTGSFLTARNATFELQAGFSGSTAPVVIGDGGLSVFAGTLGYNTGAGGAVTQLTSRTTAPPAINKACGAITLVSAAGSASWQTFTVSNSLVAATDTVRVVQKSGTDKYMIHVTNVAAGTFDVTFATTGGTTTEQPVFNFAVIKAVAA